MVISNLDSLLYFLNVSYEGLDAIVVEGYDGVGKGRLLNALSEKFGVIPYRPDYNLWQKYDLRPTDRWKISGFFWDIFSHFNNHPDKPMLFDRGVMSGAVYNEDDRISEEYRTILRDCKVLHILVTCTLEDYFRFQEIRDAGLTREDIEHEYFKYKKFTSAYIRAFDRSGVDYIIYQNKFDKDSTFSDRCISCGHYSYGDCRHPDIHDKVDPFARRCKMSKDKEVQDNYDPEMHCM